MVVYLAVLWVTGTTMFVQGFSAGLNFRHASGEKREWLWAADLEGASRNQKLAKVLLPLSREEFFTGLRNANNQAWGAVVYAEYFGNLYPDAPGLGKLVFASFFYGQVHEGWLALLILMGLSGLCGVGIAALQKRFAL